MPCPKPMHSATNTSSTGWESCCASWVLAGSRQQGDGLVLRPCRSRFGDERYYPRIQGRSEDLERSSSGRRRKRSRGVATTRTPGVVAVPQTRDGADWRSGLPRRATPRDQAPGDQERPGEEVSTLVVNGRPRSTADMPLRIGADTTLRKSADTSSAFPMTSGLRVTVLPASSSSVASRLVDITCIMGVL